MSTTHPVTVNASAIDVGDHIDGVLVAVVNTYYGGSRHGGRMRTEFALIDGTWRGPYYSRDSVEGVTVRDRNLTGDERYALATRAAKAAPDRT